MADKMSVTELEKKAHEALGQVVNGCYEYQFDRDVDLVHAAIRDLAAAKVEGGGHAQNCRCHSYDDCTDAACCMTHEDNHRHPYHDPRCSPAAPFETRESFKIAEDAIDLFLEYRDKHGCDESTAKAKALCEFIDAAIADASREGR